MAWNPSPEVAVARDAAKKLGNARACVVVWITNDGESIGMASFGIDKSTCADCKPLGKDLYERAKEYVSEYRYAGGDNL